MKKPTVKLIDTDSNAFAIMGKVHAALKEAGYTKEQIDDFYAEAASGDWDHLLRTVMEWVEVE